MVFGSRVFYFYLSLHEPFSFWAAIVEPLHYTI